MNHEQGYLARLLPRTQGRLSRAKVQPTMIKLNGVLFFTEKGKSLWKTPGHAKSALNNDIKNYIYQVNWGPNKISHEDQKLLIKKIIDSAEFLSITISDDMIANLKF